MLGIPGVANKQSKRLRRLYGIDNEAAIGLALIVGHPKFAYHRALTRTFGEVRYFGEEMPK